MKTIGKWIWLFAIALNFMLLLYFWIGSTVINPSAGTSWGFYFILIGIPLIIIMIISVIIIVLGGAPDNIITQLILIAAIILVTYVNISWGPIPIRIDGWLPERIYTISSIQTTDDEKYEYSLEITQRNNSVRLFVINVATSEETRIPINVSNEIVAILLDSTINESLLWSRLFASADSNSIYYLAIIELLNGQIKYFEIDIEAKTSRRME
ncbi:MAG: hypothetical protein FWE92_03305 [Defluviitaleaceae bacterium]|nr:hypothetical protein [Defluviitaleaceae bacterium]